MPADRTREHTAPVAAARRRRLRADRARQLADLLRHQLLGQGFPDGVLPHEDAIGADYGASRNTVRQVLDLLRAEQLVERLPGVGTVVDTAAAAALADPAWQVRTGAATALTVAAPALAVPVLTAALADTHADVRKAAVRSLRRHPGTGPALASVADDPDADVRAYARLRVTS